VEKTGKVKGVLRFMSEIITSVCFRA
jgi:hypothetical protein